MTCNQDLTDGKSLGGCWVAKAACKQIALLVLKYRRHSRLQASCSTGFSLLAQFTNRTFAVVICTWHRSGRERQHCPRNRQAAERPAGAMRSTLRVEIANHASAKRPHSIEEDSNQRQSVKFQAEIDIQGSESVFRKCIYFMTFLMSVVGACHAAEVFPGGPRFDGTVTIVGLTGASCATFSDQPGDVHTAIFRTKSSNSSLPEALQITMPRGVLFIDAAWMEHLGEEGR